MFQTIRSRLWLTYLVVSASLLCSLAFALIIYLIQNPNESRQVQVKLRLVSNQILQRSDLLKSLQKERAEEVLIRADDSFDVWIVVFDPSGNILANSRPENEQFLINNNLIPENRLQPNQAILRDENGGVWLYNIRPFGNGYLLFVAAPQPKRVLLSFLRDELLSPFFQASFLALILSLIFSFLISKWVATPVQKIAAAARSISGGDLSMIEPEGPREIQELGIAFNDMSSRILKNQQAQRDLIANISHELRTPLTSIQGFAQAILDGTAIEKNDIHQAADIIHTETSRMNRMVTDLLEIAKLDSDLDVMKKAEINLSDILLEVINKFQPISQQVRVKIESEIPQLPVLYGDSDRLTQVFTNLLDNALKYSPTDSQVTIKASASGSIIEVTITDAGPGIPPDELGRIFERFYQVDKARPFGKTRGVGLGLPIAREIISTHRGTIIALNNSDRDKSKTGCTFIVKLPNVLPDITTIAQKKRKS